MVTILDEKRNKIKAQGMKELYSFEVNKEIEVEEKINNDDGSVTIRKVTKEEPVRIFLKSPSRKDLDGITFIHKSEYGKALSAGMLNKETMLKKIVDNGGIVPYRDEERGKFIIARIKEITDKIKENPDDCGESYAQELQSLNQEIQEITDIGIDLYAKTAEAYAEDKTILYTTLSLTFYEDTKERVFKGDIWDSKLEYFYHISDNPDKFKFEISVLRKAYICFHAQLLMNPDDITKEYLDIAISNV